MHIPALDKIHEDEAEGVQSKAKEVSKSSSESGRSSRSSVSIETSKEDKSVEESSQLQFGYHSFHRLNLNSEPNSMHDNSFEEDEEQKNANSEGDANGQLPTEFSPQYKSPAVQEPGQDMPVRRLKLKDRQHIDVLSSDDNCDIASPKSDMGHYLEQSTLF